MGRRRKTIVRPSTFFFLTSSEAESILDLFRRHASRRRVQRPRLRRLRLPHLDEGGWGRFELDGGEQGASTFSSRLPCSPLVDVHADPSDTAGRHLRPELEPLARPPGDGSRLPVRFSFCSPFCSVLILSLSPGSVSVARSTSTVSLALGRSRSSSTTVSSTRCAFPLFYSIPPPH